MLYNASEAHLFCCMGASWIGVQPIMVPDSFSQLGVTTPYKSIGTLVQGAKHLKGTDVCHVSVDGVRLDASFSSDGSPFIPPKKYFYNDGVSMEDYHWNWAGDRYGFEATCMRFGDFSPQFEHLTYKVVLDYSIPAKAEPWQSDWSVSRWQKIRPIRVTCHLDADSTGWLGGYDRDTIVKAPHHAYHETYLYEVYQIAYFKEYYDSKGVYHREYTEETGGSPTKKLDVPSWKDFSYQAFILNEKFHFIDDVCTNNLLDCPWYHFNQGPKASAFLKAVEGFPTLDSNSWANMIEIISILRDLKRGKFSKAADVPKKWYEWWLQYRYRYSTTKSDTESLVKLKRNLQSFHESFGNYRRNVYGAFFDGSTGITWRCEVQAVNRAASQIEQIYHGFETLGFGLTIYNLWDLVPYSFVVDWIFPVGNVLEAMQTNEYLSSDYWDYESICYSTSYPRGVSDDCFAISAAVYNRWYEQSPPNLNQYYWIEEHSGSTSLKTGIFRLIDGLSLLVAGRH